MEINESGVVFAGKLHVGRVTFGTASDLCHYMTGRLNGTHEPYIREQCFAGIGEAVAGGRLTFDVAGWSTHGDKSVDQVVAVEVEL